jgi:hypothetical protein
MSHRCSVCGEVHQEMPAIAFNSPDYYAMLTEEEKTSIATLSEDFCIIEYEEQTDRFIRAVLTMPIIGTDDTFEYGVWVSLSEENFVYYMDNFNKDLEGENFFGYLCNQIPGYEDTLLLQTTVVCGPRRQRPMVFPGEEQIDNQFVKDCIDGISQEEADKRIHIALNAVK